MCPGISQHKVVPGYLVLDYLRRSLRSRGPGLSIWACIRMHLLGQEKSSLEPLLPSLDTPSANCNVSRGMCPRLYKSAGNVFLTFCMMPAPTGHQINPQVSQKKKKKSHSASPQALGLFLDNVEQTESPATWRLCQGSAAVATIWMSTSFLGRW
jgi:hypothetical protein